jgi:integrase
MIPKAKRPRGTGSIFTKRGVVWIKYHDRGVAYRESTAKRGKEGHTAAGRLLKQRAGQIYSGKFRPRAEQVRVADLRRLVEADYAANERKSARRVTAAFDHLEEYFTHTPAIDIPRKATAYIAHRKKEKAKPATVAKEIAALRRGFTLAVRAGILAERPILPMPTIQNARQGFADDKTMATVLKHLPDYLAPFAEFLYRTAWRRGEGEALRWVDIDMAAGEIRLHGSATKTGAARTFPYTSDPRLAAIIADRLEATKAWERERGELVPLVFWRPTKRGAKPLGDFRDAWETAVKAAAVPGLLVHDLRRSRARIWSQAGVPDRVGMQLGGWATRSVYDRYRIVSGADMRDALKKATRGEGGTRAGRAGK